jgi:hypothetical protein
VAINGPSLVATYVSCSHCAGSHYDIGRQEFKLGRIGSGGIEAGVRWLGETFNAFNLNVIYTEALADPPLEWIIECVQAVDVNILPARAAEYKNAWELRLGEGRPWLWWHRAHTLDAYDAVVNDLARWGRRLHSIPLLKDLIPQGLDLLKHALVLSDRHIPLYSKQSFYTAQGRTERDTFTALELPNGQKHKYKSQAYKRYLAAKLDEKQQVIDTVAAAAVQVCTYTRTSLEHTYI